MKWVDEVLIKALREPNTTNCFEKCLKHIRNSKEGFYKYYSFESQNTWANLLNDIIYLSKPLSFNDPFDCNPGISADQVFRAAQPEVFQRLFPQLDKYECKKLNGYLFDNKPLSEAQLSSFKSDIEHMPGYNKLIASKPEDFDYNGFMFMLEHPEVWPSLIANMMNFGEEDSEKISALCNAFSEATSIIQSIPDSEQKNFIASTGEIMGGNNDLLQKYVGIARLLGKDAGADKNEIVYRELDKIQGEVSKSFNDCVGVSCFSKSCSELLMWAHYANKHTGICVEYDFSALSCNTTNVLLVPVNYMNERPLIPIEKLMEYKECVDSKAMAPEVIVEIVKTFLAKSKNWKYEKEWRLLALGTNDEQRKLHIPCIKRIITGVNISKDNYNAILEIAKQKNVPVERACLKREKYELEFLA